MLDGVLGNASKIDASRVQHAELNIWISGTTAPFKKQFNKKLGIYEVPSALAACVLR